jgi:hypothetical protein
MKNYNQYDNNVIEPTRIWFGKSGNRMCHFVTRYTLEHKHIKIVTGKNRKCLHTKWSLVLMTLESHWNLHKNVRRMKEKE